MGKRAQREVTRFDFAAQRRDMVERHIAARGVRSESVLRAMRAVRREEFLPSNLREFAYEDSPLPIASGQTISQPYVVAFMIEALLLKGGEDVLEIGTGSGHAAAIVCTENPIRIDWRRESPNVSAPNSTQSTVRPKITVTKSQYEVAFFL